MRLSISIQAHESRAEYFPHLRERLGDVAFFVDVDGEKNLGCWLNNRRAWLAYNPKADFHVVIQDDAIVCQDFQKKAQDFIKGHSDHREKIAFNFFLGYSKKGTDINDATYKTAIEDGFLIRRRNAWGVAICMPTHIIPQVIELCDKYDQIPQDDVRLGKALFALGYKVCYPVPSLIEHRKGKSLVGNDNEGRHAYQFIEK